MSFKVDLNKQTPYDEMLAAAEAKHGLPANSLKTVMMIENRNDPKADRTSPAGAKGLMQVMPFNLPEGTDPFDPAQSIEAGAKVLSNFYTQYDKDPVKAIIAYNGGNRQAHRYENSKPLTSETSDYVQWASDALNLGYQPTAKGSSTNQRKAESLNTLMGDSTAPTTNPIEEAPTTQREGFLGDLDKQGLSTLAKDAEIHRVGSLESMGEGFKNNVTGAMLDSSLSYALGSPGYSFGEEQEATVRQSFPNGLDSGNAFYLRTASSDDDLKGRIQSVQSSQAYSKNWSISTGFSSIPGYAGNLAGMALDPVMIGAAPAGPLGELAGNGSKALGVLAKAGDGALIGGAATAYTEKQRMGELDPENIMHAMAAGAVLGGGFGLASRALRSKGIDELADHMDEAESTATLDHTTAEPREYTDAPSSSDGLAVDFASVADETAAGPDGALVSGHVDHVLKQAENWDETLSEGAEKVHGRRAAWYSSRIRSKLFGWADSEGLRLAQSESKTARWLGAHLSGDQSGLGKQVSRNAAVSKEVIRGNLQFKHVPAIKDAFIESLAPTEYADFMAGGGTAARGRFSREVQLERTAQRKYKAEHDTLDGYASDAPEPIKRAADALNDFHEDVRNTIVESKAEGWEAMRDTDSVGYIAQTPDYVALQRATPAKRAALFDMVREDYVEAGRERVNSLRAGKDEYLDSLYDFYNKHPDAPGLDDFLHDPDAFFNKHMDKLEKKISTEMERRAGNWWSNALANPEERYTNSEASLLQLVREMSQEHFEDRLVDKKVLDDFRRSLTEKWADKRRREFDMSKSRVVDGEPVYLLDMFKHDALTTTVSTINQTAGRAALAKLGWRSEQDIANTVQALRSSAVPEREVQAATAIFDEILGRFKGVDDQPSVRIANNLLYSAQMGKLPIAQLADVPSAISNLGVHGLVEALGDMAPNIVSGKSLVQGGKLTHLGKDMRQYLMGLEGRDNELWTGVEVSADGNAMDTASGLLSRSAAATRLTNTLSGANIVSRTLNGGLVAQSVKVIHKAVSGKGTISEARLADVGLHPEVMERIKSQYEKYGNADEFGLDRWDDPVAKEDLINATYKYAYQTNMDTTLAGDNPKWVRDNLLGALFSKFRVIGSRAQERMLVRNATIADSNTVNALLVGASVSTMFAYARIHMDAAIRGDSESDLQEKLKPLNVANTSLMYMSMLGLGSEVTNFMAIATGGGAKSSNDTALTGYVTKATDAGGKAAGAVTGAGSWGDAGKAGVKLLPGSNTYGALMAIKALTGD